MSTPATILEQNTDSNAYGVGLIAFSLEPIAFSFIFLSFCLGGLPHADVNQRAWFCISSVASAGIHLISLVPNLLSNRHPPTAQGRCGFI